MIEPDLPLDGRSRVLADSRQREVVMVLPAGGEHHVAAASDFPQPGYVAVERHRRRQIVHFQYGMAQLFSTCILSPSFANLAVDIQPVAVDAFEAARLVKFVCAAVELVARNELDGRMRRIERPGRRHREPDP